MSFDQFLTVLLSPSEVLLDIFSFISTIGLIVVMFSLGAKINFLEVKKIFTEPKDLLTGLFFQVVLIPVIGIFLILTTNFPPNIKLAILIIACMPSAATSNFITSKFNGDVSLSITLTSICTLLTIYTIPFFLNLFSSIMNEDFQIFNFNYTSVIVKVFITVTLPIVFGMAIKYFFPQIKKIEKNLDKISFILFLIIIKFAIYISAINIENASQNFIAVFSFMGLIIFFIFITTKLMNTPPKRTKALVAEALLQNNILGFLVIFSISKKAPVILPTLAIYGACQYSVIVLLFIIFFKKKFSIYNSDKI